MARTRLAITAFVILLIGKSVGTGTLATFTGETSNSANILGNTTLSIANIVGSVVSGSNCFAGTNNGTCATAFSSQSTAFVPGAPDKRNTITIVYTGGVTTGTFGLYAANYASKAPGGSSLCTATNPGSKINLQIKQGSRIIYPTAGSGYGTLADFATTYIGMGAILHLKGGTNGSGSVDHWTADDSATFTINVNLDSSADYTYEGCQSQADLIWYASQ